MCRAQSEPFGPSKAQQETDRAHPGQLPGAARVAHRELVPAHALRVLREGSDAGAFRADDLEDTSRAFRGANGREICM